jgi:hypothetical protein
VAGKALRAMAEHRLEKKDSAREWLEKARTGFANRPPSDCDAATAPCRLHRC